MTNKQIRVRALGKATFAVVVWGASFIATKLALREATPVVVIWLRFGIGVIVLGGFVYTRREFAVPAPRELGYFSLLGFLGITFHQWLQVTGLQTAQATTTAWIITTIPVFIAILGWFMLKEELGWDRLGGIVLAAFGVLLVVTHGNLGAVMRGQLGSRGDLLVFFSAPNWAVFSVLSRKALRKHPATQMMFSVMLFGWIFTSVWLAMTGHTSEILTLSVSGWLSILFLGIFCSGFAYIFWYDALKEVSASQVGSLLYIEPLVAVVVAAFVLDERVFIATVAGGVLIIAGVWLVNRVRGIDTAPD